MPERRLAPAVLRALAAYKREAVEVAKKLDERGSVSDGYSEFFVQGGGIDWHEAFTDVITGSATRPTPARPELRRPSAARPELRRPAIATRPGASASEGYSEFFVQGGGIDWHEAFTDVITGGRLARDPKGRADAIAKLDVMAAYRKIRASTGD